MQPRAADVGGVAHQVEQHRLVARPDLPEEERVEDLRGLDELRERLPLVRRQRRDVSGNINRRKTRRHRRQLLKHGIGLGRGRLRGLLRRCGVTASAAQDRVLIVVERPRRRRHQREADLQVRLVHSGAGLQRRRIRAEPADRHLPHLLRFDAEDQLRIDVERQPRRRRELLVELTRSPAGVADDDARGGGAASAAAAA